MNTFPQKVFLQGILGTDLGETVLSLHLGPEDLLCKETVDEYLLQIPTEWGKEKTSFQRRSLKRLKTILLK